LTIGTGTFPVGGYEAACAGHARGCRAGTGEATWVAVGALKNQSQSVGVIVLTIGTGTFPTEGEEVASAGYTVVCKRSVTSPAAWVAARIEITHSIYWCLIGFAREAVTCEWPHTRCTTCMAAVCIKQSSEANSPITKYINITRMAHNHLVRSEVVDIDY
jgi:hypothetical protein